jgi:arylsulfatase A-like enzyme
MRQTTATLALLALVSALPAEEKGRAAAAGRPNILLIMADDMGYSDIGCYGGEIHTPNLDKLAAGGIRFTQFYNTGRCCPTRASLMTGLYPHQAGIGWMMKDQGLDGYRGDLNTSCRTIAEVLRPAGYATYMSGKWHVTKKIKPAGPADKHADAGQHLHHPRQGLLLHRRHHRPRREVHQRAQG